MTTLHTQNGRHVAAPSPTVDKQLIDLQIEAEVNEIRAIEEQIETLEGFRAAKKSRLRTLLEQRGSSWEDGNDGYARIVADFTRTSYDAKALDELTLQSPWWHARLNKFRRSFSVRGGVQVK